MVVTVAGRSTLELVPAPPMSKGIGLSLPTEEDVAAEVVPAWTCKEIEATLSLLSTSVMPAVSALTLIGIGGCKEC